MDAYELYQSIQALWMRHVDKKNGTKLGVGNLPVCVWTSEGYKAIKQVKYNEDLKIIELELDE